MDAARIPICALIAGAMAFGCGSPPSPAGLPVPNDPAKVQAVTEPPEAQPPAEQIADLYVYTPAGRRDPFRSPHAMSPDGGPGDGRKLDPLERFDLDQLRLEGVIWGLARPLALITAPDGVGYAVSAGTRIGKHGGRVERILADRVVVAESYHTAHDVRVVERTPIELRPGGSR